MPTKTLYLKDVDIPLFERAQEELGESISALFADCLRQQLKLRGARSGRYEYKFVQIPRPPKIFKNAVDLGHQAIIAQHTAEGWRFVQIHAPEQPAVPHYFELIFERDLGQN